MSNSHYEKWSIILDAGFSYYIILFQDYNEFTLRHVLHSSVVLALTVICIVP